MTSYKKSTSINKKGYLISRSRNQKYNFLEHILNQFENKRRIFSTYFYLFYFYHFFFYTKEKKHLNHIKKIETEKIANRNLKL